MTPWLTLAAMAILLLLALGLVGAVILSMTDISQERNPSSWVEVLVEESRQREAMQAGIGFTRPTLLEIRQHRRAESR